MRAFDSDHHESKMLNIGCGQRYHPAWTNLDLESVDPQVIQHDIAKGIPFADGHFNVVYHSHVLEHLTPEDGERMMLECYRVLRPGGVLRVIVPDLEQIARLYLDHHELAWQGHEVAKANYDWMKLELIDQMVRGTSGGKMGQFMTDPNIPNVDFIQSRIGDEIKIRETSTQHHEKQIRIHDPNHVIVTGRRHNVAHNWLTHLQRRAKKIRIQLASSIVGWLLGKKLKRAFEEGVFRSQGEVHRWMYDRHSLRQLCEACGFEEVRICSAFESEIENFSSFELDSVDGVVRKPDSLFIECRKPGIESRLRLAA